MENHVDILFDLEQLHGKLPVFFRILFLEQKSHCRNGSLDLMRPHGGVFQLVFEIGVPPWIPPVPSPQTACGAAPGTRFPGHPGSPEVRNHPRRSPSESLSAAEISSETARNPPPDTSAREPGSQQSRSMRPPPETDTEKDQGKHHMENQKQNPSFFFAAQICLHVIPQDSPAPFSSK